MTLRLPQEHIDEMIAHAREDAPNECCGIIAGVDGKATKLYRAINGEASPYRYSVEPKDLLRIFRDVDDRGWEFMVIYHSHTATEAYPSRTDIGLAMEPNAHYVLVSTREHGNSDGRVEFRPYRIVDGEVTEEEVAVVASHG